MALESIFDRSSFWDSKACILESYCYPNYESLNTLLIITLKLALKIKKPVSYDQIIINFIFIKHTSRSTWHFSFADSGKVVPGLVGDFFVVESETLQIPNYTAENTLTYLGK